MAKVLVIEDDGDLQQLLSLVLFKQGYEAHYAFNGKEGHDKMLALRPDIILLDMMLPVLSGMDLLKLIAADPHLRGIPVIVMTGHSGDMDNLERTLKEHGVREYVRKPFEFKQMVSLIARLLAQSPKPQTGLGAQAAKGVVRLDVQFRTVWVKDKLLATLSPHKAELLKLLMDSEGPVKREKLIHALWGAGEHVSALEKTIQRLREDFGPEGHRIQTTQDGYELIG